MQFATSRHDPGSSLNIADHVARHARRSPQASALSFADHHWTYGELDAAAAQASNVLAARGVLPGDRVILHLPNSPVFIIAYLAALRLGAIPVSIPTGWMPESVGSALQQTTPRLIITTGSLHRLLAGIISVPSVPVLIASGDTGDGPRRDDSWESAIARASDTAPVWRAHRETPAAILFSSGTTTEPKGVLLSHGNVATNARLKAEYCGLRASDRVALVVPLFHCFGQNAVMNAAFHAGACVVLADRFDATALAGQVISGDVSVVFGVPSLFSRLLEVDALTPQSLGKLRYVLSAASTLPVVLAERWHSATGLAMHEAYGLTESSPFAAYNHQDGHVPGTLGEPIAGVRMSVVNPDNGAPCEPGERGEIVMQGHNVMLGYWNRPHETDRALRGGWLHTGDVGFTDERGLFHLVDRAADLVKVAGYRVYPATVEAALLSHPLVVEASAFGTTDDHRGERLEAAVVLAAPVGDIRDLQQHCAATLAPYEVPAVVHVCRELPRSATGKIARPALRAASSHPLGLQYALDDQFTFST